MSLHRVFLARLSLFLPLLLSACAEPSSLQQELRVAVPPSYSTYLPSTSSEPYSRLVATALQNLQVPAAADYDASGDWRLLLRIWRDKDIAIPTFTLIDSMGEEFGIEQTSPVPLDIWRQAHSEVMLQAATEAAPRIAALIARVQATRKQKLDQHNAREATESSQRQREAAVAAERTQATKETQQTAQQAAMAEQAEQQRQAAERLRRADPNSLYNRPARITLTAITGAPGNGNQVLGWLLRDTLRKLGDVIEDDPANADFTVKAKIDDVMVDTKTRRIEIFWLIHNARNEEVGEIVQLNEVPTNSLDQTWGTLGGTVTNEAANAIHDVILIQAGRR